MSKQFLTAKEAAALVTDGATVATDGFVQIGAAEEVLEALEERFLSEGHPKDLTYYYAAGQGDGKTRCGNHFGNEGMVKRIVGGHWGLAPRLGALAGENKVEAYNVPQGVVSHMYRDAAIGMDYTISKVGLETYVDPDLEGGKLNSKTTEDIIHKVDIMGDTYLAYKTPKLDFVFIKGTYADSLGNVSFDNEPITKDATSMATACKANGGTVIVQVEKLVEPGSLDPKSVVLSLALTDVIVVASDVQKYHPQVLDGTNNACFAGKVKELMSAVTPPALDERKVIGRRAAMEVKEYSITNLGIGMPELVAAVINEEGEGDKITLSVEAGSTGGVPAGGAAFGAAYNAYSVIDQDKQFDFYQGGCLDMTCLGLAQCDKEGNINVSKFGPRIPGCGGFIDISQNTKNVIFCGTFTAKGLKEEIKDGKLTIVEEGQSKKFIDKVEQVTFSAKYAMRTGQNVLYITERAVFKLVEGGIELIEIAPGVDLEKDILAHMEFKPLISDNLKTMDPKIFTDALMGLKLK